jgi:hypothetical protein
LIYASSEWQAHMNTQHLLLLVALGSCFIISYLQTKILTGSGTDNSVHLFLANAIRENRHRLFVRVPRIINPSYCSSFPLFLHWHLSFLNPSQIKVLSQLLNPLVNCGLVLTTFIAANHIHSTAHLAGWASLAFALTPQLHHTYSARNYGLSARPVGIFLFTLLSLCWLGDHGEGYTLLAVCLFLGYLIWGFNTFGQQSMLFMSVALGVCFNQWRMLAIVLGSMGLFMIINRAYAVYYLLYTFRFMKAYATDLASVFINKKRYSIWRDLIWDIWIKMRQDPVSGCIYAYQNSLLIVIFLNPLSLVAFSQWFQSYSVDPVITQGLTLITAGFLIFIVTTFRPTRFLGEPERYIEMITPVAIIVGVLTFHRAYGPTALTLLLAYYALINVAQIALSRVLVTRVQEMPLELVEIRRIIDAEFGSEGVRFSSNDEQVTKYLMDTRWEFARIWSSDQIFGRMRVVEAVSEFPYIRKEPFETALRDYGINACVLHKTNFPEIFDRPEDRHRLKLLMDSAHYRVYRIRW